MPIQPINALLGALGLAASVRLGTLPFRGCLVAQLALSAMVGLLARGPLVWFILRAGEVVDGG